MAREDLHFRLRIPEELKRKIEAAAEAHGQSMTAEIVSRLDDSFMIPVRLPEDLFSRITLYAERHLRSAEEEIVRLLEREYPEQWQIDERMKYLADMLSILASGRSDPRIDLFIHEVQETVEGVITGKVKDVDEKARNDLSLLWEEYQERIAEQASGSDLDEEEEEVFSQFGHTQKMAEPIPDPRRDSMMLMDFLPPKVLSAMTRKLLRADTKGAAEVLDQISPDDLRRWIDETKLPMMERDRRRSMDGDIWWDTTSDEPFNVKD